MPLRPEATACERFTSLLDALADGELSARDLAFLDRHSASCPACAEEEELARQLARGLARLPRYSCPAGVTARVLRAAEGDVARRASWDARLGGALRALPRALQAALAAPGVLRPAIAAGAVALAATVWIWSSTPPEPPAYSPSEVAQAQAQLQLAFAYLHRMGEETGGLVKQELVDHMVSPAFRALSPAGKPAERN